MIFQCVKHRCILGALIFVIVAWVGPIDAQQKPVIKLIEPNRSNFSFFTQDNHIITSKKHVLIKGKVKNATKLTLNGKPVKVDKNGRFYERKALRKEYDYNTFSLIAVDDQGKKSRKTVKIYYQPDPNAPPQTTAKKQEKPASPGPINVRLEDQPIRPLKWTEDDRKKVLAAGAEALDEVFASHGWKGHRMDEDDRKELFSQVANAVLLMQEGLDHYYQGRVGEAQEAYEEVVKILPQYSFGYVRLGSLYYKLGQVPEALSIWNSALKLNPNNVTLQGYLNQFDTLQKERPTTN